jgi:curved DNA-binding protein CbpA
MRVVSSVDDLYSVLQVSPQSSPDQVNRAYTQLREQFDPAQYHSKYRQYAVTRTAEIDRAYRVLSDPAERRRYDRQYQRKDRSGKPVTLILDRRQLTKALIIGCIVFLAYQLVQPAFSLFQSSAALWIGIPLIAGLFLVVFIQARRLKLFQRK